ncbi:hypothetical protein B0H13DRAFT_1889295 [Mycena leptocephala]|nr:hypothetical protein B0H13DRAFT_1889295 [Mycena leptocephala]
MEVTAEIALAVAEATPLPSPEAIQVRSAKRRAEASGDDERAKKVVKTSEPSARAETVHPSSIAVPKSKLARISNPNPERNKSATAARNQRDAIKQGKFLASAVRTRNFLEKCRSYNSDAGSEETASQAQCSTCKSWKKMKEPYSATRLREHVEAGKCSPPVETDPAKRTLDQFSMVKKPPKAKNPPPPTTVNRPCPGLTRAFDELFGDYLDRTASTGGGAHAVNHYSDELFKTKFLEHTPDQKDSPYSRLA